MRREEVLQDLVQILTDHGVEPIGADGARRSNYTEHRIFSAYATKGKQKELEDENLESEANIPTSTPISTTKETT